jgi:dsDNA-binding SOS-regulon protein
MSRAKLTSSLPPTPCTPDMRARVEKISKDKGVSLAEIQRDAIALFLAKSERKSISTVKKSINQGVQS